MDTLNDIASVAGILSLTIQVTGAVALIQNFHDSFGKAYKQAEGILRRIQELKDVVQRMSIHWQQEPPEDTFMAVMGIQQCQQKVANVENIIRDICDKTKTGGQIFSSSWYRAGSHKYEYQVTRAESAMTEAVLALQLTLCLQQRFGSSNNKV
jgi:uncharacterized protein YukE